MQSSEKPKIFCCIFIAFFECTLNFEHFEKEISLLTHVFLKLSTTKDVLTYMHERSCFWKPFGSEGVNESQKLLKTAEKCIYLSFSSL